MTDGPWPTRRHFLGGAGAVLVLSCRRPDESDTDVPARTLTDARFATLVGALDALVPGPDGALDAGAADYLDGLLGAFDTDPPRIFAGGPYSGRHGGPDGFCAFTPLTRVEEIRWRTWIEGSLGIAEREFAGPVVGLVTRVDAALDALEAAALADSGVAYPDLALEHRRRLLGAAPADDVEVLYAAAVEGTYGDPAYGGNRDFVGWDGIGFEGDRQPIGYTARQMSAPEEG